MMKNLKLEFDGERIKIRKLRLSDAEEIYRHVKDKEVVRWTLRIPHPYPKDGAAKFIRKTHYNIKQKKGYAFGIILKETDTLIGIVGLSNLDWENKNATLGYWLAKGYWGKGLMTEAVNLILKFGFEKLKLHRIQSSLFEKNIASKKVLEKCGFRSEGVFRETRFRYGKWHDELRYGILKSEYKKRAAL